MSATGWNAALQRHWLDLLLVALLLGALVGGLRRGFFFEVLRFAGLGAGILLGAALAPVIALRFLPAGSPLEPLVLLTTLLIAAAMLSAVGAAIGLRIRRALGRGWIGRLDAVGGAIVAVTVGAAVAWYLGLTLARGPVPSLTDAIGRSAVLRGIDAVAPRPPAVLAKVQGLLDRTFGPAPFAALRPPAAGSPAPEAAATPGIARAARSTVQITGIGCGGRVLGSGFPAAPGLVVTNAHVVAGTAGHRVILPGGATRPATVVLFDPQQDVAVLAVPNLGLAPLPLRQGAPAGTTGAVIGYPGGGPQTISGARISEAVTAMGRDIYSEGLVRRAVYVLRTSVHHGDSGGPLVDSAGRVIGVVFAASTSDVGEAYALQASVIAHELERATSRAPAGVGACAA